MRNYYLSILAACSLLIACAEGSDTTTAPESAGRMFFDLEAYFNQEISRLDSLQPVLEKTVTVDGEREEQQLQGVNFEEELQIFRRSNINRPSWADKYQVDSLLANDELEMVRYTALDTTLNTRLLSVRFAAGTVQEILIENRARSAIARTEQNLEYRPDRGYRIESKQKTIGAAPHQILVEVSLED